MIRITDSDPPPYTTSILCVPNRHHIRRSIALYESGFSRRRSSPASMTNNAALAEAEAKEEEEDTETKLAILASIFTNASYDQLLDILIRADGNINRAIDLHLDSATKRSPSPSGLSLVGRSSKRPKITEKTGSVKAAEKSPVKPVNSVLKWTSVAEPPRKVPPSKRN